MVQEEEEAGLVTAALETLAQILQRGGARAAGDQAHVTGVLNIVKRVMRGQCACLEAGGEGEDQGEGVLEAAVEVIPALGRALGPARFGPCFTGLLALLLRKAGSKASAAERSCSVRAIAESVAPLCGAGVLAALLRHLLPVLRDSCRDAEEDCRNNAVFALGELLLWGGQELGQHRGSILTSLTQMLKVGIHQNHQRSLLPSLCQTESCPSVLDNLAGALARAVTADVSGPQVAELVEEVRARLPLQDRASSKGSRRFHNHEEGPYYAKQAANVKSAIRIGTPNQEKALVL